MTKPTTAGLILYEGPSLLDGSPIVCIATGLNGESGNHKTGPMVQTWILPRDVAPEIAVTTGEDAAVCGSCSLRGIATKLPNGEQVNRFRGCYVFVGQAPQKIWESYKSGDYGHAADLGVLSGKLLRIGAYGDPCAVPLWVWASSTAAADGWTGYTHQWRDAQFQEHRHILMASVESDADGQLARQMGWRTFRVAVTGERPARGEFHCPASSEQGYRETCESCGSCNGVSGKPERSSVVIWPHGPPAAVKSFYRLVRGDSQKIDHRTALNDSDRQLLAALSSGARSSAAELAERIDRGTQAVATRLWHLRQMGLARRVGRGMYEAVATP
jgi:hypothetical protein